MGGDIEQDDALVTTKVVAITQGRLYYGWWIVATGMIVQALNGGIPGYILGVAFKPMSEEFGWTRAMFSGVESTSIVVGAVFALFVGPIIDKRGARALMIIGAIIGGASFAALSLVQDLWGYYLIRAVAIPLGVSCAGFLTVNVAVSNWFIRKRGRAMSIAGIGPSFTGVVLVPLATYLIGVYGWRLTWVVMGIIVWVMIIPPVVLFMKRRPEDIGLLPDGDPRVGDRGRGTGASSPSTVPRPLSPDPHQEVTWTRAEAMRTSALWLTILTFGLGTLGPFMMGIHYFPFLTDIGMDMAGAASVVGTMSVAVFVSRLLWGVLIDKYQVRRSGLAVFVCCCVMMAILAALTAWPSLWLVYFSAIMMGVALGGQVPVQDVLWANYFGRLSLGAVRSIALPFSLVFSAGSPLFAGWVYDRSGSYQPVFIILTLTYVMATILFYFARPPLKKQ